MYVKKYLAGLFSGAKKNWIRSKKVIELVSWANAAITRAEVQRSK
jgi:hypothetical protein